MPTTSTSLKVAPQRTIFHKNWNPPFGPHIIKVSKEVFLVYQFFFSLTKKLLLLMLWWSLAWFPNFYSNCPWPYCVGTGVCMISRMKILGKCNELFFAALYPGTVTPCFQYCSINFQEILTTFKIVLHEWPSIIEALIP